MIGSLSPRPNSKAISGRVWCVCVCVTKIWDTFERCSKVPFSLKPLNIFLLKLDFSFNLRGGRLLLENWKAFSSNWWLYHLEYELTRIYHHLSTLLPWDLILVPQVDRFRKTFVQAMAGTAIAEQTTGKMCTKSTETILSRTELYWYGRKHQHMNFKLYTLQHDYQDVF